MGKPTGLMLILARSCVFLFFGFLLLPLLIQNSDEFQRFIGFYVAPEESQQELLGPDPGPLLYVNLSIPRLIADIREAVQVALQGSEVGSDLSDPDRKAWEEHFPCRSRVEMEPFYQRRKHVRDVPPNKKFARVLEEYAVLHRVCMSRIGDPRAYIATRNESTGCKFLIAEYHFGLGNKLLHMASLVVYAILTQRVILIPWSSSVPVIMCEPFPGSSWSMGNDLLHLMKSNRQTSDQLYDAIDADMAKNASMDIYASQGGGVWGPEIRFWCNTEQSYFSKVTWLSFDGCTHFLPKLFAIARFRPTLEALFPERIVLTHVLRAVMLPADRVWERILQVDGLHLQGADKQVGVQVRFLHGEREFKKQNALVNEHVSHCLWENDILPEPCPLKTPGSELVQSVNCSAPLETDSTQNGTTVLVASLFLGLHDHLKDMYLPADNSSKGIVNVVQLTHEKTQGSGVQVDSQALVEMIALSFSDVLLVTPMSTFGGLAQAYGGLIPYFIEYNEWNATAEGNCQRGTSIEPCYLGSIRSYDCHYDSPAQKNVDEIVPYLQRCLPIDVGKDYEMLLMNGN